ncbi:XdhC family protein [Colwellia sp. 4_MG-2023]|jgi:xanthine dehydrogenase accessory factor|uniref:XdhC family protein n=1 Tax=unclassified Colwellia TaxID=196834 RepID=UPI002090085C|nr:MULTISPECIES: XdhC/CoxI family protein [unclassified Colwellia]MDO6508233.1 XdhC family protein [Colwellia sp. 5_MG-2023]MDO6555318.1 XdhC family protein [Colwellia sp. 4_MG-2023]MDO6652732.1 XdhC family protein [Colwellia sp. 3_MG-2023]MDO6665607.1 XdhC family protein [Colwellia sp. 2_MG-2023]MDO6689980.1 XdhC family protein [Colwellia sp. 1_MG-2023]
MNISNHLSHLLTQWYPNKDNCDWVLATIYKTEGPCYRKAGAMMLFSSQGHQLGMLSGGCLESDIAVTARKVMQTGVTKLLCYDGSDEDDMSFHLGIGCGGTIYIMLQQIHADNDYLSLIDVYEALNNRTSGYFYQRIVDDNTDGKAYFEAKCVTDIAETATLISASSLTETNFVAPKNESKTNNILIKDRATWLATPITPEPHLLIVGGGIDARPLVNMAKQLGWQVSLWDPRPANARKEYFANVDYLIKGEAGVLATFVADKNVNAAILMSHNISIDAHALHALAHSSLQYMALLGPQHRKQQVIMQANIKETMLPFVFAGPAGLNIGGTLPESIALSILAECHANLFKRNAQSFSQVL